MNLLDTLLCDEGFKSIEFDALKKMNSSIVPVDLEIFLYDKDYLGLEIRLSERQLKALKTVDDINPKTNKIEEVILQWGKGCLSGDVIIEDVYGNKYTVDTIYKEKKEINIYALNKQKNIEIDKLIVNSKEIIVDIFEVELEDGKKIKCTGGHMFLEKNSNMWVQLNELKQGDEIATNE